VRCQVESCHYAIIPPTIPCRRVPAAICRYLSTTPRPYTKAAVDRGSQRRHSNGAGRNGLGASLVDAPADSSRRAGHVGPSRDNHVPARWVGGTTCTPLMEHATCIAGMARCRSTHPQLSPCITAGRRYCAHRRGLWPGDPGSRSGKALAHAGRSNRHGIDNKVQLGCRMARKRMG